MVTEIYYLNNAPALLTTEQHLLKKRQYVLFCVIFYIEFKVYYGIFAKLFLSSAWSFVEVTEYCTEALAEVQYSVSSTKLKADGIKISLQKFHNIPYYISFISVAR